MESAPKDGPTVVVAEKPSVARDLAAFLGARSRRDGYLEGNGYQVTWAFGHLVELKEPQDYDPALKRWTLESLPIVPARFELRCGRGRGVREQFEVVRGLMRRAGVVVCATDAGREGELIFRYIQRLANDDPPPHKRLWLNSLTEEAIRSGFQSLRDGAAYDDLFAAARCRSEADWLVGLNATRAHTVRGGRGVLWSVGRVQTPVLALICRRDDEIRCFVPKAFFEVLTRYRGVAFKYKGGRFENESDPVQLVDGLRAHPFTVGDVKARVERALPPLLPDLTDLQREMNRRYGFPAADTLEAAQALYEGKLITYPRTDSRHLSRDMVGDVKRVLTALQAGYPEPVAGLDLEKLEAPQRIFDDAKVSDHHAIIPTGKAPGGISQRDRRVYDVLARRLIAAFYPPCVKEITTVQGSVLAAEFTARGVRIADRGWTAVLRPESPSTPSGKGAADATEGSSAAEGSNAGDAGDAGAAAKGAGAGTSEDDDNQELPAFVIGESGPHEPFVREGTTKPPARFNENSLLGAMETAGKLVEEERLKDALRERGLGTPATRASIIETLLHRRYIRREGKKLIATDLGRYLIAMIQDPLLKSPEMTGEWEAKLKAIERGGLPADEFMQEIVAYTRALVLGSASSAVDRSRLGSCPRCAKEVIEGNHAFGCSGWREGCGFVLPRIFKGMTMQRRHVQELLQRRLLQERVRLPEDARFAVLAMTDDGAVIDLEPPSRDHQQEGPSRGKPKAASVRSGAAGEGAANGANGAGKPAKKTRRASSSKGSAGRVSPMPAERKTPPAKRESPRCPSCGAGMIEQDVAYRCARWREGCAFSILKEIAGKKITKPMAKSLLTSGRTRVLKGFMSKSGRPFGARLRLDGGQVRFEFEGDSKSTD